MFCKDCDEEISAEAWVGHVRAYHADETNLPCSACDQLFSSVHMLSKHWYSTHHTRKRKATSVLEQPSAKQVSVSASECVEESQETSASQSALPSVVREFECAGEETQECGQQETSASALPCVVVTKTVLSGSVPSASSKNISEGASSSDGEDFSDETFSESEDVESCDGVDVETAITEASKEFSEVKLTRASIEENALEGEVSKGANHVLLLRAADIANDNVAKIMESTKSQVSTALLALTTQLSEKLQEKNIDLDSLVNTKELIASNVNLFNGLENSKKQDKYFKEKLNVVPPVGIPLGSEFKDVHKKSTKKTVIHQKTFMYVPIQETVEKLINHPDYRYFVENGAASENSKVLDSYMKGEKWKTNPVLRDHPDALRFILYYDDLEVCAPLKSKAGVNKLGSFYLLLDNIPAKFRSTLSLITLVALVNTNLVKASAYGIDAAMEEMVKILKKFERGCNIRGKQVFGTLIAFIGDNLGSHTIGGFKEGFTATHPCRYCLASLAQVRDMVKEDASLMREKDSHEEQCSQVQTERGKNAKRSTEYGINRNSILNKLSSYHVIGGLPPDLLHDYLEGVLPLAIKKLLKHFLYDSPICSLHSLNERIRSFDYGYSEKSDKPSELKEDHIKSEDTTLHQSGCQVWLLSVVLPLVLGPLIPAADRYYQNFLDCLEIGRILFTVDIEKWMVSYLEESISNYLEDYKNLYKVSLIPKQHFMIHYPNIILQIGSLVNYLCIRCEAKHKYFKDLVNKLHCYKNIPLTLAEKHQFHQAYDWSKSLLKRNTSGPAHVVRVVDGTDAAYGLVFKSLATTSVIETTWLQFGGTRFEGGSCFVCVGVQDSLPMFLKVEKIIIHPKILFVCHKVQTVKRSIHFSAYLINVSKEMCISSPEDLCVHSALHAHKVGLELYIAVKVCAGGSIL